MPPKDHDDFRGLRLLFSEDIVSGPSHMDECLYTLAVKSNSSEEFHRIMPFLIDGVHSLADVAVASLKLPVCNRSYIHIVSRMEELCLSSGHRLEEIKVKSVFQPPVS